MIRPPNEFHPFEASQVKMPWLWLGTWSLGGEGFGSQDLRESRRVIEKAFESGVRHWDTAGIYAHGNSERLLGQTLASVRKQVFISTKGGLHWHGGSVVHRASREALREHLSQSLERLGTDYVDLFQLHWPDPEIPLAESLDALTELREEGLAKYIGVGNLTAAQLESHLSDGQRIPHQVHFNPIFSNKDVLRAGRDRGRCLNCVISPFEQGLLTGKKYDMGVEALGGRDLRRRNPLFRSPEALQAAHAIRQKCEQSGLSVVSHVLSWILAHDEVDVVIPGPRTMPQLEELLQAAFEIPSLLSGNCYN